MKGLLSRCLLTLALFAAFGFSPGEAHESRPTIATLTIEPAGPAALEIRLELEAILSGIDLDQTPAAKSAYEALRALGSDALRREFDGKADAVLSVFEVKFDGRPAPARLRGLDIPSPAEGGLPRISLLRLDLDMPARPNAVSWLASAAAGDSVIRILQAPEGRVLFAGLLPQGQPSPEIALTLAQAPRFAFVDYLILGFEHILPKGLDHILFVIGLFLLNPRPKPLLYQVSAFTLAHCLTLALGIYGVVRAPPGIVEPLIAASIVFIAVENLATDKLRGWRPVVVFGFGLLHGLGFAGVLAEIGLPEQQFLAALLGFNLGVELGQIAVLAGCFLAVGFWFRDRAWYRGAVAMPASAAIGLVGAYWFIERIA